MKHLTTEEIMEWLFVHPELSWDDQIKALLAIEREMNAKEPNSVSHWGMVA
jgi:hypothetical protein